MDRRILKTRNAIYDAFCKLIIRNDYNKITIQDIINEANIGRSTFYEHFETKDNLLDSLCIRTFDHIFHPDDDADCVYQSNTFKEKIIHILYHLLEIKDVLKGILRSEGHDIFLNHLRRNIEEIVEKLPYNDPLVPIEFLANHVSGSFIETVTYWAKKDFIYSPDQLGEYFIKVLPSNFLNEI